MAALQQQLLDCGYDVVYAFSKRVSEENPITGEKKSVFKHEGFYLVEYTE